MGQVRVVTAYVPIENPRPASTYRELGTKLAAAVGLDRLTIYFGDDIEKLWLYDLVASEPSVEIRVARGDNPAKNTLAYHAVQHQKSTWLSRAARAHPEDVLVWLDYGIFHQRGVTEEAVRSFLDRAGGETDLTLPGAWNASPEPPAWDSPCWRFLGSMIVAHRSTVDAFDEAVRSEFHKRFRLTRLVEWEVNTWARAECSATIAPRWYEADHDVSMFDNYPGASPP